MSDFPAMNTKRSMGPDDDDDDDSHMCSVRWVPIIITTTMTF